MSYESFIYRERRIDAREAFLRRRRRPAKDQLPVQGAEVQLPVQQRMQLANIFSRENVYQTAIRLRQDAGPGAGPDGVRSTELTNGEIGNIAGVLSAAVPAGLYRPGRRQFVPIAKPGGGTRTLRIPNFLDRVAARCLQDALQTFFDPKFVDNSYGFRPSRGTWQMIAKLKAVIQRTNKWALVVCDIRQAFDSLLVDDVVASFRQLFRRTEIADCSCQTQRELLSLIKIMLQGGEHGVVKGIDTGCPFSPLALNVHLHLNHDLVLLGEDDKTFWFRDGDGFRYADNLVYPARDVAEGRHVLDNVGRHFLGCELPLKEDADVFDLGSGSGPNVLGFALHRQGNELVFDLCPEAIERLSTHLERAHDEPDPTLAARQCILGWISYMGPAFENGCRHLKDIVQALDHHGFRESAGILELEGTWYQSHRRWIDLMRSAIVIDALDHGTWMSLWQGSTRPIGRCR